MNSPHSQAAHFIAALTFVAAAAAQPVISSVENAASNIPAGLPNAGMAQGAMLVVKGQSLGPANVVVDDAFPLGVSLAGTSVKVNAGGRDFDAILYYTFDRQVAAILPSAVPSGNGALTVSYNGQTSVPIPITVVTNNPAIYTLDSSGTGAGVVTFQSPPASGPFVTPVSAANPGEVIIVWANGLGAVSGDETRPAVQADMPSAPLEAYIGGRPAEVLFRGRNACCSSVDTIYLRVPSDVVGCAVPLVLKTGQTVSNTANMPIAAQGRSCTPTLPGLSSQDYFSFYSKPSANLGTITLVRNIDFPLDSTQQQTDTGAATFAQYAGPSVARLLNALDLPAFGTCRAYSLTGIPGGAATSITAAVAYRALDAGPAISITGPAGTRTVTKQPSGGGYLAVLGNATPGNYLDAGTYSASGGGGSDIGPVSANFVRVAAFDWSNRNEISNIDRTSGLTVRWTGGDSEGYISITGISFAYPRSDMAVASFFTCFERSSVGTFTIPSFVLLALPPAGSQFGIAVPGALTLSNFSPVTRFQAPGLDFGVASSNISIAKHVFFH